MLKDIRILLAEDHIIVRSSLGMLLESHGAQIVGEAADGKTAVTQALELRPDIIFNGYHPPGY